MNLRQLITTLKEITKWAEWELELIEDFHNYSHKFGFSGGSNVLENVLEDALKYRGETLEQFRATGKRGRG